MPELPILYQSADRSITLIDVPTSIAHAQGLKGRLQSTLARDEPFQSTEPKSAAARARVLARTEQSAWDRIFVGLAHDALEEIRKEHDGPWTLPRLTFDAESEEPPAFTSVEHHLDEFFAGAEKPGSVSPDVSIEKNGDLFPSESCEWDGTHYNADDKSRVLRVTVGSPDAESTAESSTRALRFLIPCEASFLLANCNWPMKFRNHVRWMSQEHNKNRMFDCILMDPPWENRSAKRRAAYKTSAVQTMIGNMDLSSYLQPNGLLGIWVTNKAAHRKLVLGEGGIFESTNVTLIEEWIWVKTTSKGEPVTQLDGIWRKPYEVLLLGRAPESRMETAQPTSKITRRVIAAVPDSHSRKPCLKTLIEPYLPINPQVLEIFARYLVQGWTSWGNEVLKYNCECYLEQERASTKQKARH